jgi:PEGA domain
MLRLLGIRFLQCLLVLCTLSVLVGTSYAAGNEVLGEIQLKGHSGVDKTSGVWVDGQYVGFLKELKGTKKILLLPGDHEILVRQAGFRDFEQKVTVQPGVKHEVRVNMAKDSRVNYPTVTAQIKLAVYPTRAAVFVDGLFLGHVAEFQGAGKALLVAPGRRKISISLPGYRSFETEIELAPHQKFKLATNLISNGVGEGAASQ